MHRHCHSKPSGVVLTAIALLLIACVTPRTASADEKVPRLNVEPSCRFQASMQSDKQVGYEKCMEQERGAKAQLEKTWAQYTLEDRAHCLDMTNELGGNTASYVEVLECVTLTKDARAYEKKFPSDMDISIGQGQGR